MRVAIIDDEADVRKAVSRMLRSAGHDAQAFSCGEEYLRSDSAGTHNCILLDVNIPSRSGWDVYADLRSAGVESSVIFITGGVDAGMGARAASVGAAGPLRKPLSLGELIRAFDAACGVA